jgi:hypothetical protein
MQHKRVTVQLTLYKPFIDPMLEKYTKVQNESHPIPPIMHQYWFYTHQYWQNLIGLPSASDIGTVSILRIGQDTLLRQYWLSIG